MQVPDWLADLVTDALPDPSFDEGNNGRRLIVIHTAECPEQPGIAPAVAAYLARTPGASAHFCVDADRVVMGVHPDDSSWAAPGVNDVAVNIEMAGYAGQGAAGWADDYSQRMIALTARLVRRIAEHYRMPLMFVGAAGILRRASGVTTHAEVTRAFPTLGTGHMDPGPTFPMTQLLAAAGGEGDDMPLTNEDLQKIKDTTTAAVIEALTKAKLVTNAGNDTFVGLATRTTIAAEKTASRPTAAAPVALSDADVKRIADELAARERPITLAPGTTLRVG